MQQLELFDYRKDYLFESSNQIAHYYDILKETEDTISYAEHIDPKKGYGFITPDDDSKDVFLHISALEKANITQLEEKQIIKYELAEHRGKMSASNIEIVKE